MTRQMWTPAQDAEMIRLTGLGWDARTIGLAINRTKAGVNSRRHHLGLTEAPKERRITKSLREKVRVGSFQFRNPDSPSDTGPKKPSYHDLDDPTRTDGHTILEAASQGCRWPIGGEMADTRFCCRPRAKGSYCAEHARRAYTGSVQIPDVPKELKAIQRRAA